MCFRAEQRPSVLQRQQDVGAQLGFVRLFRILAELVVQRRIAQAFTAARPPLRQQAIGQGFQSGASADMTHAGRNDRRLVCACASGAVASAASANAALRRTAMRVVASLGDRLTARR